MVCISMLFETKWCLFKRCYVLTELLASEFKLSTIWFAKGWLYHVRWEAVGKRKWPSLSSWNVTFLVKFGILFLAALRFLPFFHVILVLLHYSSEVRICSRRISTYVFTYFDWQVSGSYVWKERNNIIFRNKHMTLDRLLECIKFHLWWWLKNLNSSICCDFYSKWSKHSLLYWLYHNVVVVLLLCFGYVLSFLGLFIFVVSEIRIQDFAYIMHCPCELS